jgi:hypothetical protein
MLIGCTLAGQGPFRSWVLEGRESTGQGGRMAGQHAGSDAGRRGGPARQIVAVLDSALYTASIEATRRPEAATARKDGRWTGLSRCSTSPGDQQD